MPCFNNAVCHDAINSFTCECRLGFEGELCEVALDPCLSQPCFHGGTCETLSPTLYTCHCQQGYLGDNCERENDPCGSSPCQNRGRCTKISPLNYLCECVDDFEGRDCEIAPVNKLAVASGISAVVLLIGATGTGYWVYTKRALDDKIEKK